MKYSDLELNLFAEKFSLLKRDDAVAIFRREHEARQETEVDRKKYETGMGLTGVGVAALLLFPFSCDFIVDSGVKSIDLFYAVPLWLMVGIVCVILGSVTRKNAATIKNIPASSTTISFSLKGDEVESYKAVGDLNNTIERLLSGLPPS